MVDFRKLMSAEQLAVHDRRQANLARERPRLAAMTSEALAAYAQRCVDNSEGPRLYPAGEPVYDNAMWHLILPELIRRCRNTELTVGAALSGVSPFEFRSLQESTWRQIKPLGNQLFQERRWIPKGELSPEGEWDDWHRIREHFTISARLCLQPCWLVDDLEATPKKLAEKPSLPTTPAVFCSHANEVPQTCTCQPNCYCRVSGSCRGAQ